MYENWPLPFYPWPSIPVHSRGTGAAACHAACICWVVGTATVLPLPGYQGRRASSRSLRWGFTTGCRRAMALPFETRNPRSGCMTTAMGRRGFHWPVTGVPVTGASTGGVSGSLGRKRGISRSRVSCRGILTQPRPCPAASRLPRVITGAPAWLRGKFTARK